MVVGGEDSSGGDVGVENGQQYILEPEAILDHCVAAEGKRWYLVKWKPRWVKKHELPEGVFEKWQERKNGIGLDEPVEGFRILQERRVPVGEEDPPIPDLDESNVSDGSNGAEVKEEPLR